eukprot:351013-Chlamydomonas_euryale.AAC.1
MRGRRPHQPAVHRVLLRRPGTGAGGRRPGGPAAVGGRRRRSHAQGHRRCHCHTQGCRSRYPRGRCRHGQRARLCDGGRGGHRRGARRMAAGARRRAPGCGHGTAGAGASVVWAARRVCGHGIAGAGASVVWAARRVCGHGIAGAGASVVWAARRVCGHGTAGAGASAVGAAQPGWQGAFPTPCLGARALNEQRSACSEADAGTQADINEQVNFKMLGQMLRMPQDPFV